MTVVGKCFEAGRQHALAKTSVEETPERFVKICGIPISEEVHVQLDISHVTLAFRIRACRH